MTLADFCNLVTTHEHTLRAFRSSHASGALAPLHAGINGCRLRWPKDALPHRGPVSRILLTTACARRAPLAWTRQIASRDHSSKGKDARSFDDLARSLLVAPRTPELPTRAMTESGGRPSPFASAKDLSRAGPAKGVAVEKTKVFSSVREPLRERKMAPPCAPGP
jgi:hypothetical protein